MLDGVMASWLYYLAYWLADRGGLLKGQNRMGGTVHEMTGYPGMERGARFAREMQSKKGIYTSMLIYIYIPSRSLGPF